MGAGPGSIATVIHPCTDPRVPPPSSTSTLSMRSPLNVISNDVGACTGLPNLVRTFWGAQNAFGASRLRLSTLLTIRRQQHALICQTDGGGYFVFPSRIRVKQQVSQCYHTPFQPQLAFNEPLNTTFNTEQGLPTIQHP